MPANLSGTNIQINATLSVKNQTVKTTNRLSFGPPLPSLSFVYPHPTSVNTTSRVFNHPSV